MQDSAYTYVDFCYKTRTKGKIAFFIVFTYFLYFDILILKKIFFFEIFCFTGKSIFTWGKNLKNCHILKKT